MNAIENTQFDLSAAASITGMHDEFMPPIFKKGRELSQAVTGNHVNLEHTIVWRSKDTDGFYHKEQVGEIFNYHYAGDIKFRAAGEWDHRTPILHPAVAGLDVTAAGFDEAYIRALSNMDVIITGRREEYTAWVRNIVTRSVKSQFHPFRVLVRAAALWGTLTLEEISQPANRPWAADGQRPLPKPLFNLSMYAAFCREQSEQGHDVLYTRCEDSAELFMVDVLQALCSDTFPIRSTMALARLWPALRMPRVAYSAPLLLERTGTPICANDVRDTMRRFCDMHDCHDLWKMAIQFAQCFVARPTASGVVAGTLKAGCALPESDMRIGAIGPLLAGVTAEGMKTEPFMLPSAEEFAYGGAVRGLFMTASYFEGLRGLVDNHPVRFAVGTARFEHFENLASPRHARAFVEKAVAPRAAEAGWDCFVEPMRWITPMINRRNLSHVLNAGNVPWWTSVIPHLPEFGGEFLKDWLLPARLSERPDAGRWYACRILGITTEPQVAAALRWTRSELRYTVLNSSGSVRRVNVALASVNRFMPPVQPFVIVGKDVAIASVKFPSEVVDSYELLRKLGNCQAELFYDYTTAWEDVTELLGDTSGTDGRLVRPVLETGDDGELLNPYGELLDRPVATPPTQASLFENRRNQLRESLRIVSDTLTGSIFPEVLAADVASLGNDEFMRQLRVSCSALTGPQADRVAGSDGLENQIKRLRAYCHLTTRAIDLTSHHLSSMGGHNTTLGVNRANALQQLHHLERILAHPPAAMEADAQTEEALETLSGQLAAVAPVSAEAVTPAPDDPVTAESSPQGFGSATSPPGSESQPAPVGDVADLTVTGVAIGFLPPASSSRTPEE